MPVNVIGTLKPKNNGKFPVAEAVDIKVTEDLRLDEALENKADLVTLNYALANKADKTTTTSLQNQINEIVAPVTQDAEVQNARVGADGTSYETLKSRLDAEVAKTADTINELKQATIVESFDTPITAYSTIANTRGAVNDTTHKMGYVSSETFSIKVFAVEKGKKYRVHGFGYDRESFYVAAISDEAFTEICDVLQTILCGGSDYPDDYTYHTVDFVCEYDGYIAVNYKNDGDVATLIECTITQKPIDGYAELVEDVAENTENIEDLLEALTVPAYINPISAYSTFTNKRVSENFSENKTALTDNNGWSVKVFQVTQGVRYRVRGFGYDRESFYVATISDEPFTGSGTLLQTISCGGSEYPDDYTYHTIDFVASASGYLGVNYKTAEETAYLLTEKLAPKAETVDSDHLVIKTSGEYNVLSRLYKNIFVSRTFKHCNANNLFQLYKLGYGIYEGGRYSEVENKMTATTDIIGPVSIGRYSSQTGYEAGEWSGGNHTKTIDGSPCKTAEETSFKAICAGTDITSAADGTYNGKVTFIAENDLYFPQTITDDQFTGAVKAIHEKREYRVAEDMDVKVSLKMLYDDVGVSAYYGMQIQIPTDVTSINNPHEERLLLKSDNENVVFSKPSNIFYLDAPNGWHYDMELKSIGLQDREYIDTSQTYVMENYGYGKVTAGFGKIYQSLITHNHFADGTLLTWSGAYKMYHD